ncbi:MAG: KdsC family phosphatase [Gemmatimonas sp.]|jgi:3-deoxy-D-manno-octulosonate 8-phosphate phosphatase (KDO 8-P phosphatase)|uniref:KdsC family phosphatase n=1 Tax=Gemmatimonas sp. TaxID=1962908 RepID=UPI00391F9F4E|nr:HAD hydrolase family protein [Gemmatimonadota bacterium]
MSVPADMETAVLPAMPLQHPRIEPTLARRIRLVCFDVDGVLTDGGIYLGATLDGDRAMPFEFKRFDIQDGLGIVMLRECGLTLAIITGRVSEAVAMRAKELRVEHVVQDVHARKLPALRRLCADLDCPLDDVAFVGDDLPDLGVMRGVGLPVAVGNAVPEVRRLATLQLTACGGRGAVREFAEALLQARGEWMDAVERYVRSRSVDHADGDLARAGASA